MEDRPEEAPVPPPPSSQWAAGLPPGGGGYEEPPPPSEPRALPPLPWEDPGRPWLRALVETIALLYQRPREAFERMAVTGDPLRPVPGGSPPAGFEQMHEVYEMYRMYHRLLPVLLLLSPLWILVGVLVSSAIRHLFLMLVGGAKRGFQATLRTVCYANAGMLLAVVPFVGGLIALLANAAFEIIGLSAAHRITKGRAALAVVLPGVFCCACLAFTFVLLRLAAVQYAGSR